MRDRIFRIVCVAACLIVGAAVRGQEGHPLVGTWHGTWSPAGGPPRDITLVVEYDGKALSGLINPGLDSARLQNPTLDAKTWTFRFEADMKQGGAPAGRAIVEATIEDITNRRRSLLGTWTQGTTTGALKMTRDD
jgi:hypothetical protein